MHEVCMVKLSAQREVTPLQSRPTRTQRVLVRQEELKRTKEGVRDLAEFNKLKTQAEQLQQTEFSNIQSVDEYQQKYNLLDPKLKPFFSTPDQLKQTQVERIETTKTKIQEKITTAQQKKKEVEKLYRSNLEWASRNNRSDDDLDAGWEEDEAYYNNYIRGLNEGLGKLNANQDVAYGDILAYASDLGHYYKDRQEARYEGRKAEQRQLAKLKGTQPFLIQEIESGKVVSEKIAYQDPTTKAFISSMPLSTSLRSIAGLEKSSLGRTEVTRTFELGAKKHEFILRPQLYKTPSGKLTTELGGITEKTEMQIMSDARDQAFKEWKVERKDKPIYVDYKSVDIKLPYTQRGTINKLKGAELQPIVYPEYEKTDFKIVSSLKRIWDKIPSGDWYYNPPKLFGIGGGISLFKTSDQSISLKEKKKEFKGYLDQKTIDAIQKEMLDTGIGEKLETKYQKESQLRFEDKYMKQIIYEEINQKDAIKEFEKSDDYKIIQKKYGEDIAKEKASLGLTKTGFKIAGLQFGKLGVSLIPTTTKGAIGEGVLIYTGYKALKVVPPVVHRITTGGFGVYGGYKFLSPTSLPEERATGLVILGISAGSLGLQGIKYLRQPTIKAIKIPSPKATLRTHVKGYDVKYLTDKGIINKVVYENQKLSQVGVAGRRTIVSTKFRDLVKLDPIYKGVPYAHKSYLVKGLRSSYVYQTPSGYQKAFDIIKKAKFVDKTTGKILTTSQIKNQLRYIQPKVINQYLSKGVLTIKGTKAVGGYEHLIKQPVISVDKTLGIKTRGARTIRYRDIERKLLKDNMVLFQRVSKGEFLERGASPFALKDYQKTRGVIFGKASETKKGFDILKTDIKGIESLKQFKSMTYKDLVGVSVTEKILPSSKILKLDIGKTQLINKIVDMRTKSYVVTPAQITKTPLSKTFAIQKEIKVTNIKNILKQTRVSDQVFKTSPLLKQAPPTPSVSAKAQIKNILKVEQSLNLGSAFELGLASVSASALTQKVKTSPQLKADLKLNKLLREELKSEIALKQAVTLKSAQALATQQVALLETGFVRMPKTSPVFQEIPIIQPTLPKIPVIPIYFPPAKQITGRRRASRSVQDLAFFPDFTAKALGLKEQIITEAQAKKKLKKLLTGLEIRRPVKVKF